MKRCDSCCLFLLDLAPENLYDGTTEPHVWRCRACRDEVNQWEIRAHWDGHRREEAHRRVQARLDALAKARAARTVTA